MTDCGEGHCSVEAHGMSDKGSGWTEYSDERAGRANARDYCEYGEKPDGCGCVDEYLPVLCCEWNGVLIWKIELGFIYSSN